MRASAPSHPSGQVMPYLALGLSVLFLGLNWPVMKLGLDYIPPFWMVSLRFLASLPVIALLIVFTKRRLPRLELGDISVILGVGMLQCAGMMGLVTLALTVIPAGTASILIYTTPLWLMLIQMLHPGPTRPHKGPALLSAVGCGIILPSAGQPEVWGALSLILLAAVMWALAIRQVARHRWQGGVCDALFWQFLIAAVVIAPVALWIEGPLPATALTPTALILLSFIGPVASGLGFGLMIAAGRTLPASRVALLSTATPIIGFGSATLLLGEPVQAMVVVGGAIMMIALIWGAVRLA